MDELREGLKQALDALADQEQTIHQHEQTIASLTSSLAQSQLKCSQNEETITKLESIIEEKNLLLKNQIAIISGHEVMILALKDKISALEEKASNADAFSAIVPSNTAPIVHMTRSRPKISTKSKKSADSTRELKQSTEDIQNDEMQVDDTDPACITSTPLSSSPTALSAQIPLTQDEKMEQFKLKIRSMGGVSMGGMGMFSAISKQFPVLQSVASSPTQKIPVIVDEEKLKAYINTLLGPTEITSFHEALKTGVLLLKLVNCYGQTCKINTGKFKFVWYENIQNYFQAAAIIGVDQKYNFNIDDLVDGTDMNSVLVHLTLLSEIKRST